MFSDMGLLLKPTEERLMEEKAYKLSLILIFLMLIYMEAFIDKMWKGSKKVIIV